MNTILSFDIRRQPDATTCGPTCLHALYRYYGDTITLEDVVHQVPRWPAGGTLAVHLAIHALRRGYQAKIYPYNLTVFDPTWCDFDPSLIAEKLKTQLLYKKDLPGFEEVTDAYLEYLSLGGRLEFKVLTPALIRSQLKSGTPILTGLSATYLYNEAREVERNGKWVTDDVRGESSGHFVVLSGYSKERRRVQVADPLVPNPMAGGRYYDVDIYRLVCAIMLGILTYDGNLLTLTLHKKDSKMAGKEIQKEEQITVDGYVEKVELEDGKIGVVVYDGESDYYIAMDEKGKELRRHVNEQVEITGTLSEKNGDFWINITDFYLIEDYEDVDDDDYDPNMDERWSI